MKYKIEIWRNHAVVDTYESDDKTDAITWARKNYGDSYYNGECYIEIYSDGVELSDDERLDSGLYD